MSAMAVELRCPECRAKLRLPKAPEPDSEIECPKCSHVFATDENIVHAGAADDNEAPKKKPKPADESPKKSENNKSDKPKDKPKAPDNAFKRKKRKAKKRKTNPAVLWGIVGGAVVSLIVLIVIVFIVFGRKKPTEEMMSYLPDDCDSVTGINVGHVQKYPEFYKTCETQFNGRGFKKAMDVLAAALGSDANTVVDYVMQGEGKSGNDAVEATVIRTKSEFDPSLLSKMPGAKEYSGQGVKYYTIDDIPELKYSGVRVFAPTNRIVVFCREDTPQAKFNSMLTGNKDHPDATPFVRAGPLIKAVTRGTAWKFVVYGRSIERPQPPVKAENTGVKGGGPSDEDDLKKEIADILNSAKGMGYKASVGSRDVRGEWIVWMNNSDALSNLVKKWKEKDWVKDDEKPAPRWWKMVAQKSGGGKTAENALKDYLKFMSSGELFIVRGQLETKVLSVGTLVQAFTGQQGGSGTMSSPGGGAAPGGAAPGGKPGGGAPGNTPPGNTPPGKTPPGGQGPGTPGGPGPMPMNKPRRRRGRFVAIRAAGTA